MHALSRPQQRFIVAAQSLISIGEEKNLDLQAVFCRRPASGFMFDGELCGPCSNGSIQRRRQTKAEILLKQMTLDEKVGQLDNLLSIDHSCGFPEVWCAFETRTDNACR
ncbi:MAG: hypothetical protein WCD57_11585 [Acidobacteriaceae bacterium]